MIETFGIFIALAFSFFPTQAPIIEPVKPEPQITTPHISLDESYTAQSVLLFNFNTNARIVEHSQNKVLPIASITKIMTGYLALKNLPPESKIQMSTESIETAGAIGHFKSGEIFSFNDLLEAMMTASSNDAAMAFAERVGTMRGGKSFNESIQIFVDLMNETAKNLGMYNTHFINPTGLDTLEHTPSNYSTAEDLSLLLKATRKDTPTIWELSRSTDKTIYSDRKIRHDFFNINTLAPRILHFIGGKTGSTDTARESVIELFEAPFGTEYGLVLLGADPEGKRFEEALRIINQLSPVLP